MPQAQPIETLVSEMKAAAEAATQGPWHKFADRQPVSGAKIIALYDDGSGAAMYFVHDGGVIDQDGDDYDRFSKSCVLWTYLPSGFEFWCESYPEDSVTLPKYVAPVDDQVSTLSARLVESEAREGALREAMMSEEEVNAIAGALNKWSPDDGPEMVPVMNAWRNVVGRWHAALTLKGGS